MPDIRAIHLAKLSALLPNFANYWRENASMNGSDTDEHTLSGVFMDASQFVGDQLQEGNAFDLPGALHYIESVLETGTKEEQDAAATCFLEYLMNITPTKIGPNLWIPLLGTKSREFCRAWDEWTGYRTEYLHANPTR